MTDRARYLLALAAMRGHRGTRALAAAAGIDRHTVAAILRGRRPRPRTVHALAVALGVAPGELADVLGADHG